jgi:hypothetical protein
MGELNARLAMMISRKRREGIEDLRVSSSTMVMMMEVRAKV